MEKTIFKCRIGSHLYGTNRPDSDEDYAGVRLHSLDQLIGIQSAPKEASESVKLSSGPRNTFGDTDCKFFYLQRFLQLVGQGQPGQLEMLFVPDNMIIQRDAIWDGFVKNHLHLFQSRKGIAPFIGFALAQAHKAVVKGENLNLIRSLIKELEPLASHYQLLPIEKYLTSHEDHFTLTLNPDIKILRSIAEDGTAVLEIASRQFNTGLTIKRFLRSIQDMEERYGTRVRAAAEQTYDYKSLGHAVRLLSEAEEFLLTGKITLPRPDAPFIKEVLSGKLPDVDWLDYISGKIDYLKKEVEPKSPLPPTVQWDKINQLCIDTYKLHLEEDFDNTTN